MWQHKSVLTGEGGCFSTETVVACVPAQALGGQAAPPLGLDVEFAHFLTADGKSVRMPAEVCLAEPAESILYHNFCNPSARQPTQILQYWLFAGLP